MSGDEILQQLSQTCMKQVREIDTLARIGGEEFALLLPRTSRTTLDVNGILRRADEALYAAKRQGKNRLVTRTAVG